MGRSSGRVTLEDVAKATGFTINTVSRALKNKPDISRQTCEQIQKVAREMGYVRNYIASSLRSGRTKTIAMITGSMVNPFYAVLGDLIQQEAARLGYSLMILCSRDNPEIEQNMVEMALSRQVDGIVIVPWASESPALDLLRDSGVPYVLLNRYVNNERDDCILFDEEQGGYLAARHLLDHGHRKVAMVSHADVTYSTRMRRQGFFRACLEAGLTEKEMAFAVIPSDKEILAQLEVWKSRGFTGLFSFCDDEAWGTITAMESAGLRVPEDFAIVGFDNIRGYLNFPRPICSVDTNFEQEAALAIDLIRKRIHEPSLPPQRITLPVSLVCRGTCGGAEQN